MTSPRKQEAIDLFAPIAGDYQTWSRVLSFGQDPRWRDRMVRELGPFPGAMILDVAAGTGEVTRLLAGLQCRVISLDQSREMLTRCREQGAVAVLGQAEALPFPDNAFDGLTFTYLLRYVEDPQACMAELARVVRPGGKVGMVEFGRPGGGAGLVWWLYTRLGLPLAGALIAPGWRKVGAFLGPSIDVFHGRYGGNRLFWIWENAGLTDVEALRPSFGAGLVMWGRKR